METLLEMLGGLALTTGERAESARRCRRALREDDE
jgi:hypothetical protein